MSKDWQNELITKGEAVEQCFNKWNKTNEEIAESIKTLLPCGAWMGGESESEDGSL